MDKLQYSFLQIIRSAINQSKIELDENIDLDKLISIAKRHRITTMFFYGLINSGFNANDSKLQDLFMQACRDVVINERQQSELSKIIQSFEESNIDYITLKGAELKSLYPKSEMRPMGDIDILIKVDQYEEIKKIMTRLGYSERDESNHEYIWSNAHCLIELHKFLIPSYNTDYFNYFGDGWRLGTEKCGSKYIMSKEDNFIYLFTHFAKHYRDSGIGLRHIIDIWVYLNANDNLNMHYIGSEMKKLQLYDFFQNIIKTLNVWFGGEEPTNVTDFITEYIFGNGVYGTKNTHILAMALRDKKQKKSIKTIRLKKMFRSIFVSYKGMCKYYPFLTRFPLFLPIMWCVHLCKRVMTKNKIKQYGEDMQLISEEKVLNYEKELKFVGLNFNFGE